MRFKEFSNERLENIHPITESEMQCAIIGDSDKSLRDDNYGYLYNYEIKDEYKNVVFDLLEGCLFNYEKYLKDEIFGLKTLDLKSEIYFEFDQESLAHIYGIPQDIMNPKKLQTKNFLEKIIPDYKYKKEPLDKLYLMVKNKEKIIEKEKEMLNGKTIFNYPKMYVKLKGMITLKNPEENVYVLVERNKDIHAPKDEMYNYSLSFRNNQNDKYDTTKIVLAKNNNPFLKTKDNPLTPKSTIRNNEVESNSRLIMIKEPIKKKTAQYLEAHPERKKQNERKNKFNKLNNIRNTVSSNMKAKGDNSNEFSRHSSREK